MILPHQDMGWLSLAAIELNDRLEEAQSNPPATVSLRSQNGLIRSSFTEPFVQSVAARPVWTLRHAVDVQQRCGTEQECAGMPVSPR